MKYIIVVGLFCKSLLNTRIFLHKQTNLTKIYPLLLIEINVSASGLLVHFSGRCKYGQCAASNEIRLPEAGSLYAVFTVCQ